MRVLHIFSGNMYGGVERMLQTIAECKSECHEMETSFAYCFEGRLSEELRKRGEPLYHLGEARARWFPSILRVRKALRRLMIQQPFACVLCHGTWVQAIFGSTIRRAGVPDLFWQHDIPDGKHWVQRWAKLAPPDFILSDSKFIHDELPALYPGIPASPFYYAVLPPTESYSTAERNRLREELGASPATVVIIQVSRMEAWKGHRMLFDSLSKMTDVSGWLCWIVGGAQRPAEERYLESLKKLASDGGISDRVLFLGQRSDVPRLLHAADIFAQPNMGREPFGTVFIEAMYAGLPVVTTNFGAGPEVVGESCGVLVSPGDTVALSQGLIRLVQSAELRAALGKAGPTKARQLTDPNTRMNRLCDLLRDIATKHRSTAARITNGANG